MFEGGAVVINDRLVGQGVKQREAESAVGDGEGLVLGVDVENMRSQLPQERQLDRSIVDESTAFCGRQNLATDDKPVVEIDIGLGKEVLKLEAGNVEMSLDHALFCLSARTEASARWPKSSPKAPSMMDLPAPVSPVMATKPFWNWMSAR